MAIQYKYCVNESGRVISLGFAPSNYVVEDGWKVGDCVNEELPKIETLHEQKYLDAQALVQYKEDRRPLYPDIGDQLDDLYHAGVFSAEMTAKLKKVKDDNPK
tara:strand:- start:715 stop:1023 length:309 start_codon:yes stop_codon:yes gene_type:complete